jgi:O-antigen/teichoic acid export membrane protein
MKYAPVSTKLTDITLDVKPNILKRISIFAMSNVFSNIISMISSVVIARIMSPVIFGEWQTVRLFLQYSTYANFGINTVLSRRFPQMTRDGEQIHLFDHLRNSAYSFNLITAVGATVILFAIMSFKTNFSYFILFPVIIIMFMQLLYNFRFSSLIAQQNLEHTARLFFIFSISSFLFILPLTYFYKLQGAILGQLVVYLLVFFLVGKIDACSYSFLLDFRTFASLFREGSLFCLHGLVASFALGHERLLLLYLHGTTALGTYGLAILVMSIFDGIAGSLSMGLFPFLSEKVNPEKPRDSESLALEWLKFFYMGILLLSILAASFLGPMTRIFLPKYEEGLWAAFLSIGAMTFIPIRYLTAYYRASRNEIYRPILVYGSVIPIILWPNYILIRDYGVLGAAIAFNISQIAVAICLFYTMFIKNNRATMGLLLRAFVLFPFILSIGWVSIHYNFLAIPFGLFILLGFIATSRSSFKSFAHQLFARSS